MNDINSLSHTKWNCKYHVVFAPKYRRKVFYGEKRAEVGAILRQLCEWKGVRIVQAEVCPDHVHMLIEIPPKVAVVCSYRCNGLDTASVISSNSEQFVSHEKIRSFV